MRAYSYLFLSIFLVFLFISCSEENVKPEPTNQNSEMSKLIFKKNSPEEFVHLEARSVEEEFSKRATQAAGSDRGRFNIELRYVVPPTERQAEVFNEAAARWERIIIADLPSISGVVVPSYFAEVGVPPIINEEEGVIDDIVIEVALIPIDGPGEILGAAGPRFFRVPEGNTVAGVMFFDVDDLDLFEEYDVFEEVIVHEMGHVLGVGTLWNINRPDLGIERFLRLGPDSDPYYAGRKANVFWNAEGGLYELPIENEGGQGTRLSHWREEALYNELMTGWLNIGLENPIENPLSRITAGSLEDLGYGTAPVAESYDLPRGTPGVEVNESSKTSKTKSLHIAAMEELIQPVGAISIKK